MKKTLDEQIAAAENNKKNGMSYETWRERDNAGWYMSHEKEENRFERYLDYLHKNNFSYDELNQKSTKIRDIEK